MRGSLRGHLSVTSVLVSICLVSIFGWSHRGHYNRYVLYIYQIWRRFEPKFPVIFVQDGNSSNRPVAKLPTPWLGRMLFVSMADETHIVLYPKNIWGKGLATPLPQNHGPYCNKMVNSSNGPAAKLPTLPLVGFTPLFGWVRFRTYSRSSAG